MAKRRKTVEVIDLDELLASIAVAAARSTIICLECGHKYRREILKKGCLVRCPACDHVQVFV